MAAGREHPALSPHQVLGQRWSLPSPLPSPSPERPWVCMCCPSGGLKLTSLPCIPDTSPCSTQLENPGEAHNIPWTGCWCKIGSSSKIFGGGEQAALGRAPASALPCHPPPVLGCSGQSGPWHLAAPQTHASARALHRWALTQLEQQREMKNNHKSEAIQPLCRAGSRQELAAAKQ